MVHAFPVFFVACFGQVPFFEISSASCSTAKDHGGGVRTGNNGLVFYHPRIHGAGRKMLT